MVISFLESEIEHVTCPHDDTMIITINIDGYDVKKVLNSSISTNVIFRDVLKKDLCEG